MNRLILILVLIITPHLIFAQSISNDVISTAGTKYTSEGKELNWTLGEGVVDFHKTDGSILTLGFHQGELLISSVEENITQSRMKVYPNPTQRMLNIDLGDNVQGMSLVIFSLTGKKYIQKDNISDDQVKLDLTDLPNGDYILELTTKDGEKNIYKIVKLN